MMKTNADQETTDRLYRLAIKKADASGYVCVRMRGGVKVGPTVVNSITVLFSEGEGEFPKSVDAVIQWFRDGGF